MTTNRAHMLSSMVDMLTVLVEDQDDPRLHQARELIVQTALDSAADDEVSPALNDAP
jgi:hypothetical protein